MLQRVLIILILLLFSNISMAQTELLKADIIKLVNTTFDTENFKIVSDVILYDKNVQIKENLEKDFKKAKEVFYEEFVTYYSSKYTHDEIKQMLTFYETPVGKKIAGDLLLLSTNSFPKDKEWENQLEAIKVKK